MADLSYADLSHANLSHAFLSDTDLSGTNLRGTNLSSANFSGEFGDVCWNENTIWEGVYGLERAINVPEALKKQLGLQ